MDIISPEMVLMILYFLPDRFCLSVYTTKIIFRVRKYRKLKRVSLNWCAEINLDNPHIGLLRKYSCKPKINGNIIPRECHSLKVEYDNVVPYFPLNLTEISFCNMFNAPLPNLPQFVKYLYFCNEFNQPINKFPRFLKVLVFGSYFNQPLDNLPDGLKELSLFDRFNQSVKNFPASLEKIMMFDNSRYDPQDFAYLPNLKFLRIRVGGINVGDCGIERVDIENKLAALATNEFFHFDVLRRIYLYYDGRDKFIEFISKEQIIEGSRDYICRGDSIVLGRADHQIYQGKSIPDFIKKVKIIEGETIVLNLEGITSLDLFDTFFHEITLPSTLRKVILPKEFDGPIVFPPNIEIIVMGYECSIDNITEIVWPNSLKTLKLSNSNNFILQRLPLTLKKLFLLTHEGNFQHIRNFQELEFLSHEDLEEDDFIVYPDSLKHLSVYTFKTHSQLPRLTKLRCYEVVSDIPGTVLTLSVVLNSYDYVANPHGKRHLMKYNLQELLSKLTFNIPPSVKVFNTTIWGGNFANVDSVNFSWPVMHGDFGGFDTISDWDEDFYYEKHVKWNYEKTIMPCNTY